MQERTYIAIDLKSFYASVECMDRGLDPLTTNLVVADLSRTEKTICLAVSPSLKAYGISGRARLFEVVQKVREVNAMRQQKAPGHRFAGSSCQDPELRADPSLALDYVTAPPQMARYMEISGRIYEVYLRYIAPEDIHVYSIDEVFIDATAYLKTYGMSARELARTMILDVLKTTGITATAGIGTNLYLCKVAMDIEAKHIPADSARWRWILRRSISRRTRTECASHNWTRDPTGDPCGITARLRTSGGWAGGMRRNWRRGGCIRWGILPAVRWAARRIIIMRIFSIRCSASMRNC